MTKQTAKNRLEDILAQLEELGEEARMLVAVHFPQELAHADAYGVFTFGRSWNRYDNTLATLIESLDEDEDDEDDE